MSILAAIKIKAASAFDKIGKQNGTAPPQSKDNRFSVAYEFFIASTLASIANKRKEVAKAEAERMGILGEAYTEGSTKQVYSSEEFDIVAKTASAAARLDKAKLMTELIKEVGESKAIKIVAKATTTNKPATSFEFVEK